eukprot:m.223052 g.223052  ORF g.223052 m.223052 type:complete len:1149 (-) comp18744_c2_seq2:55-3501(-)
MAHARTQSSVSRGSTFSFHEPVTTWTIAINNEEANIEGLPPHRSNRIRTNKYTLLNFIPKNLYEQFHRVANIFFLFMAIIAVIPATQALSPETAAAPLATVLLITLIRDWLEDRRRARSDIEINGKTAHVFDGVAFADRPWSTIKNGDVIRVDLDETVPADILLLCSANSNGVCHIETANLDGESTLKVREAHSVTHSATGLDMEDIAALKGHITVPVPNNNLFSLDGSLHLKNNPDVSFSLGNVVLRGCDLRNTEYVYGLVIYTGHDSKIMQNIAKPRVKRTVVQMMMNIQILGVFVLLFFLSMGMAIFSSYFTRGDRKVHWYVDSPNSSTSQGVVDFFAYVLLLHSMIPLSAYVSVELVKLAHARFIGFDLDMYDADTDTPAAARTSTLSEELGMVRYLLSDKTGTITQNLMDFAGCSINGHLYGQWNDLEGDGGPKSPARFEDCPHSQPMITFQDRTCFEDIRTRRQEYEPFLLSLALCNDVIPERKGGGDLEVDGPNSFHAQSPDEIALVAAARDLGVSFYHRDNDSQMHVNFLGETRCYHYLANIEFSSQRKRMTSFVRRVDGAGESKVLAFMKGADDTVISLLRADESPELIETTKKQLITFAKTGYRTLVTAYRQLDQATFDDWQTRWHAATLEAVGSEGGKVLERLAAEMECNMSLLGATAVDDKLQEDAPQTIATLRQANISVWVLTGDKQETAVSIGHAINLLSDDLEIVTINATKKTVAQKLKDAIAKVGAPALAPAGKSKSANPQALQSKERVDPYAVVVDGPTLTEIFANAQLRELFAQLAAWSTSMICCRAAPMQKALVVNLVRKRLRAITMAVGDGANDVSMITAADIGVGISGKEGRQAVLASDYAIAKFKFLTRLLLVHGRWSYKRVALVVLYFFYKNYAYILVNFWFGWFCVGSAQTIYDQRYIMLYNVIFTSVPGLIAGVFDQDVTAETAAANPQLYMSSQRNAYFSHTFFWLWIVDSIYQSLVVFGVSALAVGTSHTGREFDLYEVGTVMFTSVVLIVNIKLLLDTKTWTRSLVASIIISVVLYFVFLFIYQSIVPDHVFSFGAIFHLIGTIQFWFSIILTVVVALLPSCIARYYRVRVTPKPEDILHERELLADGWLSQHRSNGVARGGLEMSSFKSSRTKPRTDLV